MVLLSVTPRRIACVQRWPMDDDLVAKAQSLTGLKEKSRLVQEALKALIARESARRLTRLGGSERRLKAPGRRRPKSV